MSNLINEGNPEAIPVWNMIMVAPQSSVRWCKKRDAKRRTCQNKIKWDCLQTRSISDSHRRRVVQERGYILNEIESLGDEWEPEYNDQSHRSTGLGPPEHKPRIIRENTVNRSSVCVTAAMERRQIEYFLRAEPNVHRCLMILTRSEREAGSQWDPKREPKRFRAHQGTTTSARRVLSEKSLGENTRGLSMLRSRLR